MSYWSKLEAQIHPSPICLKVEGSGLRAFEGRYSTDSDERRASGKSMQEEVSAIICLLDEACIKGKEPRQFSTNLSSIVIISCISSLGGFRKQISRDRPPHLFWGISFRP